MFKIILASPRGYCAGVHRAIDILQKALDKYGSPIYVNHEIIHNKYIVNLFEKKGVIFGADLDNIPADSIMIFSAHGVSPQYIKEVKDHGLKYIDASCPLVTKVHREAKNYIASGHKIIYIGQKNHPEAIGVAGVSPKDIFIVSNDDDLKKLDFGKEEKLALLNQTTLSIDDTKQLTDNVQKIFPQIKLPSFSDICYATTNRQEAVKKIIHEIDCLIIVGSKNISNSVKLRYIGDKASIKSYLIDSFKDLPDNFLEGVNTIGISSGASVPEKLVIETINDLKKKGGIFEKEVEITKEKTVFPYSLKLN